MIERDQCPQLADALDAIGARALHQLRWEAINACHLTNDQAYQLTQLLEQPSCETWDDAHSMCLDDDGTSLFAAVFHVDEDAKPPRAASHQLAPAERWAGYYPDPLTVLLALAYAAKTKETPR